MILSTIMLAIMAGLIYMVTSGTQISGIQKGIRPPSKQVQEEQKSSIS